MAQFVRQRELVTRAVANETVIVPIRSRTADLDSVYTVNEVAATIWELLDAPRSPEELVSRLCEVYDVDSEAAAADVEEFLSSLLAEGLVERLET